MIRSALRSALVPDFIERRFDEGMSLLHELEQAYVQATSLVQEADAQAARRPSERLHDAVERDASERAAMGRVDESRAWLSSRAIAVFDELQKNLAWQRRILDDPEEGISGKHAEFTQGRTMDEDGFAYKGIPLDNGHYPRMMSDFRIHRPTPEGLEEIRQRAAHAEGALTALDDERPKMRALLTSFEQHIAALVSARDLLADAASARDRGEDASHAAPGYARMVSGLAQPPAWRRTLFRLIIHADDLLHAQTIAGDAAHALAAAGNAQVEACTVDPVEDLEVGGLNSFPATVILVAEDALAAPADDADLDTLVRIDGTPTSWTSAAAPAA